MSGADVFQLIVSTDLFACKPSRSADKGVCGDIKQNHNDLMHPGSCPTQVHVLLTARPYPPLLQTSPKP